MQYDEEITNTHLREVFLIIIKIWNHMIMWPSSPVILVFHLCLDWLIADVFLAQGIKCPIYFEIVSFKVWCITFKQIPLWISIELLCPVKAKDVYYQQYSLALNASLPQCYDLLILFSPFQLLVWESTRLFLWNDERGCFCSYSMMPIKFNVEYFVIL